MRRPLVAVHEFDFRSSGFKARYFSNPKHDSHQPRSPSYRGAFWLEFPGLVSLTGNYLVLA